MKSLILTVAGLFALMTLGLLVGCVLRMGMRVVAVFRSKPDNETSSVPVAVAGDNRMRERVSSPASATSERESSE